VQAPVPIAQAEAARLILQSAGASLWFHRHQDLSEESAA